MANDFFEKNIWPVWKKCVLLHPFLREKATTKTQRLSYGVTVAHLTLDQLVLVRIQVGQQEDTPKQGVFFLVTNTDYHRSNTVYKGCIRDYVRGFNPCLLQQIDTLVAEDYLCLGIALHVDAT